MRAQIEAFAAEIQAHIDAHYLAYFGTTPPPRIEIMWGPKYARLVCVSPGERSAYGFVNIATGDVLKAAGWSGPAKGVRGSLVAGRPNALLRCSVYSIT